MGFRSVEDVWPEVRESIKVAGVLDLQIYHLDDRLFMIMDTTDDFTLERKAAMDAANPKVIEWETLMGRFQKLEDKDNPTTRCKRLQKIVQLS